MSAASATDEARPVGSRTRPWGGAAAAGLGVVSWLACHLPERLTVAVADGAGAAWYRLAPGRAARARANLRRVCAWLAAENLGPAAARRAADDPAALERLVRSSFRHLARYYLEVARVPAWSREYVLERIAVETPDVVERAFAGDRPAIFVAPHFGSVELPGLYLSAHTDRTPVAPMETLADPALQRYFIRTRGAMGIRIVGLREARRELIAALRRGDPVGLVSDRDLTGGGMAVPLFGAPASLPIGPALLAIESGAPVFAVAVRRIGVGRYVGHLEEVPVPAQGSRRERAAGFLAAEARAFERAIAAAPDQWWAVFFPIWPDLGPEGRS
jgi:phosphatidylinositol dimannoside acyltransferase